MNGQRSPSQSYRAPGQTPPYQAETRQADPRPAGASSLDALSRTIEGLEARIEGLMNGISGGVARDVRPAASAFSDKPLQVSTELPLGATSSVAGDRLDPLAEIRARQRALEAARPLAPGRASLRDNDPKPLAPESVSVRPPQVLELAPQLMAGASAAPLPDFYKALSTLRADLRQDISESLAGEIGALRSDIQDIRVIAEESREAAGLREDFMRMADSLERIGHPAAPETEALRADFEELRSLMDGLARDSGTQTMETRWSALEARLDTIAPERIQQDLLQLAYRLDEIKQQLGTIGDVRSVRLLEDKLVAIAKALEHIGQHLEPNSQAMLEQFGQLDHRLDEISRAISVAGRHGGQATDPRLIERLEDRIATIAHHLELISEQTAGFPAGDLDRRLEALSLKIEDLAHQQAAQRLEERLDDLTRMLEMSQRESLQPELTGYLSDISRKIDALDHASLSDKLAEQIAVIGRRIDQIDAQPAVSPVDETLLRSLDDRLYSIAARLDETSASPSGDGSAIAGLEQQIAHLSALISASPLTDNGQGERIEGRMAALEDYLATSDEYIVEAARQAAEAVMDNYARQSPTSVQVAGQDQIAETLGVLADHLRHLEEISRGGEERSHRTVEALHQTLVQIAEKLDQMDRRTATANSEEDRADPTVAAAQRNASVETDVEPIVDLLPAEDNIDAPAHAEARPQNDDGKVAKPSLIAGLSRRLKPKIKKAQAETETATPAKAAAPHPRQMIEDAPSIDPVDILPPEEANELLEPGSGKPDVRKILEKVRARQQAGTASAEPALGAASVKPASADDRMDFIAAARRAAQAAAQETDRASRPSRTALADEVAGGSAFSRYRRPILMAVGALLLAALAVSAVKTLGGGNAQAPAEQAPTTSAPAKLAPSAAIEAPSIQQAPQQPVRAVEIKAEAPQSQPAVESTEAEPSSAPVIPVTSPTGQASLSSTPMDGSQTVAGLSSQPPMPDAAQAGFSAPKTEAAKPLFEVPADLSPASLMTAAKAGEPAALFEIGSRYMEARGLPGDVSQAAVWFQRAADLGLAPAQYRLAGLYEKGTGVQRDLTRAKGLYSQAAEAGNASAMHNLAVLYASGGDGKPDMDAAAKWFARAADLGVTDSQFNLAVLYARGTGVKQDLEASYKWFALAASQGDKDAAAKQEEVARSLQPAALARAKASLQQWQAMPVNADANTVNLPDEWVGKSLKTGSVDMEKAVRNIQAILNKNGFNAGEPDGKLGARTVAAIKAFQTSVGQEPSGKVSNELVKALLAHNG
ncbi:peptidoglycan-binding protein [Agrobacterium vitis]|uniref:peptidoglycan-binding protein n=1 Tax=Agrobacterium vitis TaxID=373 RepID=UPI003D298FB2